MNVVVEGKGQWKGHTRVRKPLLRPYGNDLAQYVAYLQECAEGLLEAQIDSDHIFGYGGDDDFEIYITGWRPLTDKEKEQIKEQKRKTRVAQKEMLERVQEAEKTELRRLLEKYGSDVK